MTTTFCHLHCHTDHSMLDGVGRSSEYAEIANGNGHKAIAITDHGNLYGLPAHARACAEHGLKPIFGMEAYVNDKRDDKASTVKGEAKRRAIEEGTLDPTFTDAHLVLLCENNIGWKNMLRINHDSVLNGFYYQPRSTHDFICQHAEGLIATTACIGSQFGQLARMGDIKRLDALFGKFKDAFGDRFYCEIHVNELEEQKRVNELLIQRANRFKVDRIFTCDVHYACDGDCNRQDEMIAVSRRTALDDPKAFKIQARHLWFCQPSDAWALAKKLGYTITRTEFDLAVANTSIVADRCNASIYGSGELHPPIYIDQHGNQITGAFDHLHKTAVAGFRNKFPSTLQHYRELVERLKHELRVIRKTNMADFYLVTMDVVDFCRSKGIYVWTRGSGCASLVAAAIGITAVDPVRFDLLFERFVDPSRPNAPDFDLDIDATRRDEVIAWFSQKYGGPNRERIARISALHTFGLKSAIRDVCFAHQVDPTLVHAAASVADRIDPRHEKTLGDITPSKRAAAIDDVVEAFRSDGDARVGKLLDDHLDTFRACLTMVGRVRGKTRHAAGYVVAPDALINHLPIDLVGGADGDIVTSWGEGQASQDIGPTGLMKIDFLSLDTCTVVAEAIRAAAVIDRVPYDVMAKRYDPFEIDWHDRAALNQYASGDGFGLHQLSETHQQLAAFVKRLQPRSVDEVIAAIALYRPGSMDFLDDFIARAKGHAAVPKVHPIVDEILAVTYGIIVYQEQIMRILHRIGGIPLRKAHEVIKAISKKKLDKIKSARAEFIEHAPKVGVTAKDAVHIFDLIEKFAGYGFNRAHSTSYGVLSFITAKLRAEQPAAFYWSLLNATSNEAPKHARGERKIAMVMRSAERRGLKLLAPAIGQSTSKWRLINKNTLLAPLAIVNGVGDTAAAITRTAFKQHQWKSIFDVLAWVDGGKTGVNARAIDGCAKIGAFNRLTDHRGEACTTEYAVDCVKRWSEYKASKKHGTRTEQLQAVLATNPSDVLITINDGEIRMTYERAAIGFAHWANPWAIDDRAAKIVGLVECGTIAKSTDTKTRGKRRAFYVADITERKDKRDRRMAFLSLHTLTGNTVKAICFSSTWEKIRKGVRTDKVYLIAGEFERSDYIVGSVCNNRSPFTNIDNVSRPESSHA